MSSRAITDLPDTLDGRAALFRQLATMEAAGLTPLQSLDSLQRAATPALRNRIERTRLHLLSGNAPDDALYRSGLCQFWESHFLRAMIHGGRLAQAYAYLAQQLEARALRARKFKSRLALPIAVLTLALFIEPLPALARGDLDGWAYFARTLLPLAVLALLFKALARLLNHESVALPLLARLPALGRLVRRQRELQGLAVLGLLLRSGLPASHALELAASAGAAWPATAVRHAAARMAQGASLTDAMTQQQLCSDAADRRLIAAAEAAGQLDDTLDHLVRLRQAELDLQLDHWAEWLPRVMYFAAVAWWFV